MRTTLPVLVVTLFVSGCTDPAPPDPIAGTFALEGHFVGRVQKSFVCGANGCVIKEDTTAIDGAAAGKVTFDTLTESVVSSSVTLSLGQCLYCLVNSGSIGSALRQGDSVKVGFGVNPILRLLGVYRGDSISGRIESTQSGTVNNTYWGTFVARPAERDPTVTFTLRGLFDSLKITNGQGDTTTRSGAADSIRGRLPIDDLTTAPLAQLTIEQCGPSCFGNTIAGPPARNDLTGAGRRSGDSVVITLWFDLMSRVELRGLYRGDSIAGAITSSRNTSTATIYSGNFVARRNP
jgi:hypothetical protein